MCEHIHTLYIPIVDNYFEYFYPNSNKKKTLGMYCATFMLVFKKNIYIDYKKGLLSADKNELNEIQKYLDKSFTKSENSQLKKGILKIINRF